MGVSAYVTRDAEMEEFVATVVRCARGELHLPPRVADAMFRHVAHLSGRQAATGELPLTARERDILALIRGGLSNKEIAQQLKLHLSTVKNHVHHILEKCGVSSRDQAAALSSPRWTEQQRLTSARD
jgi:DNA-binding NarL/FixJ family response regulator